MNKETEDSHFKNIYENITTDIRTWQELLNCIGCSRGNEYAYSHKMMNRLQKEKRIDYESIVVDLLSKPYTAVLEKEKLTFPPFVIYRLWECVFLQKEIYSDELSMEGMTKSEKTKVETTKKNKRRYISSLTEDVLSLYRETLLINDIFICKCFEHGLDKILFFILENRKYYRIELKEGTLEDNYIAISCDMGNVKIFTALMSFINIHHMEYALRYSSFSFLMLIWQMRKSIPNFDEYIKTLKKTMKGQNWKQMKYFEYCDQFIV